MRAGGAIRLPARRVVIYNGAVRRFLLIVLALLVPFQAAWSAGHALYGHLDGGLACGGVHIHVADLDHHDTGQECSAASESVPGSMGDGSSVQGGDGQHGSHIHPVFSMVLSARLAGLTYESPSLPPLSLPTTFTSNIPPLFDRPPAVRA